MIILGVILIVLGLLVASLNVLLIIGIVLLALVSSVASCPREAMASVPRLLTN